MSLLAVVLVMVMHGEKGVYVGDVEWCVMMVVVALVLMLVILMVATVLMMMAAYVVRMRGW